VSIIIRAVLVGMLITFVGSIPRSLLFLANLWIFSPVPLGRSRHHSVPVVFLALSQRCRSSGRDFAGTQVEPAGQSASWRFRRRRFPIWEAFPPSIVTLLLIAAPAAGIIEEAAFRGYMQGPIERRFGLLPAILITGTMFAVAHLDFTPILWPYTSPWPQSMAALPMSPDPSCPL